ncbi:septal ring lytic transglycosylase RlpA family protein [Neisseria lisongii]|uniref:septal ring lytic transglycosylase RlpA family protein n=1 Tax=Neisseria lisongii TaxID=2912188 RepID=UPI003FCDC3DC
MDLVLTVQKSNASFLCAALAAFLTAPAFADSANLIYPDTAVSAEKLHPSANRSYQVKGKRYTPMTRITPFSETGKSSWYGGQFHGRKTASGERYNMNALTAAHRTLPIPSYAKVTNIRNGKSVIVRVNDRGPFHGSRVMDVSKAAAQQLGFVKQGTADIKIEQIVPGLNTAEARSAHLGEAFGFQTASLTQPQTVGNIYVDLKSFGTEAEAQAYLTQTGQRLPQNTPKLSVEKRSYEYTVRMGPFADHKHAAVAEQQVKNGLLPPAI